MVAASQDVNSAMSRYINVVYNLLRIIENIHSNEKLRRSPPSCLNMFLIDIEDPIPGEAIKIPYKRVACTV